METPPKITEIKKWILSHNPSGLARGGTLSLKDIDPNPWSGHFNYSIASGKKKWVLRFRGPEWGTPAGVKDEYENLKAVQKYRVGPKSFYLTDDFFGEPMICEEYLEGKPLNRFSEYTQLQSFPAIGRMIAKINKIPFPKELLSLRERVMNFLRHKDTWRIRLEAILLDRELRDTGHEIKKLIPPAEEMLHAGEEALARVLKTHPPAFVFESAHAGHCMKIKRGYRFMNWEKVSFGDPSFTLAVFLASISERDDFSEIKDMMVKEYLRINPVPEFTALLDFRLKERAVSNLLWVLWAHIKRRKAGAAGAAPDLGRRYENVKAILEEFRKKRR